MTEVAAIDQKVPDRHQTKKILTISTRKAQVEQEEEETIGEEVSLGLEGTGGSEMIRPAIYI